MTSSQDRVVIRAETPADHAAISEVNVAAFLHQPYSMQTEHLIVAALRDSGALEISLVAGLERSIVGHIAFSPGRVGDASTGWFVLGPVAVLPEYQRQGIGRKLIEAGLAELRARDASGCVLVGDPVFYRPFGFRHCPGVTWPGVPDENVLCLPLTSETPLGEIVPHPAFSITA